MLIHFWERLRGYRRWAPAVAIVESTELSRVGEINSNGSKPPVAVGWESVCTIKWKDQNQVERTAIFRAYEESPLYQLVKGDAVNLKFNPDRPSEYYLPGLVESQLVRAWRLALWAVCVILVGVLFLIIVLAH